MTQPARASRTALASLFILVSSGGLFPAIAVDGNVFTLTGSFGSGSYAAVGDFNGDGNLDLAGVNPAIDAAVVLLGNGDGTFGAELVILLTDNPFAAAVGDFNNDTFDDLAISTHVPATHRSPPG